MEEFVLVGGFLQENFVLNHLPFLKWDINYEMVQINYQLMVFSFVLVTVTR